MLEELKEENIVNKVGGRFKLSTLIQKRLVAISAGSRPLVEVNTQNKMEIVLQEILKSLNAEGIRMPQQPAPPHAAHAVGN